MFQYYSWWDFLHGFNFMIKYESSVTTSWFLRFQWYLELKQTSFKSFHFYKIVPYHTNVKPWSQTSHLLLASRQLPDTTVHCNARFARKYNQTNHLTVEHTHTHTWTRFILKYKFSSEIIRVSSLLLQMPINYPSFYTRIKHFLCSNSL